MFRSLPDQSLRAQRTRSESGFSLLEVIVSLGILVLVTAAIYPQVIVGLRATGTARDITQAKGVAQARLEQMRAMPFYVGREAGDYIDILDTYYRNTIPPPTEPSCASVPLADMPATSWTGYVSGTARHCAWEPSGPLYRKVINPIQSPGLGAFSMVVSTQFLTGSEPVRAVVPRAGYNSQVAGSDKPSSTQVGITIAVFYRTHNGVKFAGTYSQIERSAAMDPLIQTKAKVTTVHVSGVARTWENWVTGLTDPAAGTHEQRSLLANIGVIDLSGELFTGSRVVANATGAAAATSLPSDVTAAATNLVAAPDAAATGASASDVSLPNGCRWICFGATRTDQVSALASGGLPNSGTADIPGRAMIPAGANRYGFWFDNGRWNNRLLLRSNEPMVSLDTSVAATMPGVRGCVVGGTGATNANAHLTATGYLTSTPHTDAGRQVSACGTAQANVVRLFPTQFAPNGVIRISLARASAACTVRVGTASAASADYLATVQYWNGSGYTTAGTIQPGNTTDPLDAVDLTQVIDASGLRLNDYIGAWSSALGSDTTRRTTSRTAEVNVPAVVSLVTGPTRSFVNGWESTSNVDPTSVISLSVGAVSCKAGDHR